MNNKLSIIRQALPVLLKRNTVERHQAPMLLLLNFKRSRLATFLAGRLRGRGVRIGEVASLSSGALPYFVLYNAILRGMI